jgi:hypothetical protein
MRALMVLAACLVITPAWAAGGGGGVTFSQGPRSGEPPQYSYPHEPQYQYPSNSRTHRKCPKGQAVFQGRCRIKLPVR